MPAAVSITEPGLDPEQLQAVRAPRGPVCVLAGAGTGKTRTITHRIAHLIDTGHVSPTQVLAVTFTTRAASEMRVRLTDLGLADASRVQVRTFHAAALRQLRYFWPRVVGDMPWRLLERKSMLVSRAARRVGLPVDRDSIRDVTGEIDWAKASLVAPESYALVAARRGRAVGFDVDDVTACYAAYEDLKRTSDGLLLDFDDLLLHIAAVLEDNGAVADEFRDRYRCFVVDEYQDVTPLQQRVLDAWLGGRDDITVVGDASQTIYSFTGASPKYLLEFSRRYPDAVVVRLERDYRSTPQVVSLANDVIGSARGRIGRTRLRLLGQRPPGPEPVFSEFRDEPAEAAAIVSAVAELIAGGIEPAGIAVLYRINAQSEAYEQALTERGIGFQVRGGAGFFDRTEVRRAMGELQRLAARTDLPDASGAELVSLVRAALVPLGLTATQPVGAQAIDRWSSLNALIALTEELAGHHRDLRVTGLVDELTTRAEARHPPTVQGVTLASLHAAKGLEWDAVFLVGLVDGLLPISHVLGEKSTVTDEAGLEEERRLLYVGITRAREHLRLSWALSRTEGDKRTRRRSRFLNALVPVATVRGKTAGRK